MSDYNVASCVVLWTNGHATVSNDSPYSPHHYEFQPEQVLTFAESILPMGREELMLAIINTAHPDWEEQELDEGDRSLLRERTRSNLELVLMLQAVSAWQERQQEREQE